MARRQPTQSQTQPGPDLSDYRQHLVDAEQKSQEAFDKTVLSLSGGALGISFVFLKDVIGSNPVQSPSFLLAAWITWALSSMSVLASFYLSHLALRRAIDQVDDGTVYQQRAGGWFSIATALLNAAGALLFFVGVCSITAFANANLSSKGDTSAREKTPSTAAAPPAAEPGKQGNPHP